MNQGFESVGLILSAEPLVGLKRPPRRGRRLPMTLSAEPLVGLKQPLTCRRHRIRQPFSRTPRGFEAFSECVVVAGLAILSAEPLVGLKQ